MSNSLLAAGSASTRCDHCEIVLEGREQFMGHMIHGHGESVEQARSEWNFACSRV